MTESEPKGTCFKAKRPPPRERLRITEAKRLPPVAPTRTTKPKPDSAKKE